MHLATRLSVPALCLSALTVHADTLTVCLDGTCDFTDIQVAIIAASEGDVIEISGELYLLENRISNGDKTLTLRGTVDPVTGELLTRLDGQDQVGVMSCWFAGPDMVLEQLVFQNGRSEGCPGLHVLYADPTIINCSFENNTAIEQGQGAVRNFRSSPSFIDCRFIGNSSETFGGGMSNNEEAAPTLHGCRFINNVAGYGGGGVYNSSESAGSLTDCTFVGNTSPLYGGGIYSATGSELVLMGCLFSENQAFRGGAMCSRDSSTGSFSDCRFEGNSAVVDADAEQDEDNEPMGGAIANLGGLQTLTQCMFANNEATRGGGIYNEGDQVLDTCTFTHNSADRANRGIGGGYCTTNSINESRVLEFRDCLFEHNFSSRIGGGAFIEDVSSSDAPQILATFTGCRFEANTADSTSGGLQLMKIECVLVECLFEGNTARGSAGALASFRSRLELDRCAIRDNTSQNSAGGLFIFSEGSTSTITDSEFTGNVAVNRGGAIWAVGTSVDSLALSGSTICSNIPDQISAGPFANNGTNCIDEDCTSDCIPDACPADIDGDAVVGANDLTELLARWGCIVDPPGFDCARADLNEDGTVDGADLTVLLSSWGACQYRPPS